MPIYEYACESCGHRFDSLQRLSDPDPDACPACERPAVRRLISRTSFQLKGSGWYVTDYKGRSAATTAGSSDSTAGTPSGTAAKGGDTSDRAAA